MRGLDQCAPTCVARQLRSYDRLMELQDQVTVLQAERDALQQKCIVPNEHEYAILDRHNHVNFSFLDTLCDLVVIHNMSMRAAYPAALTVAQEVSLSMCGENVVRPLKSDQAGLMVTTRALTARVHRIKCVKSVDLASCVCGGDPLWTERRVMGLRIKSLPGREWLSQDILHYLLGPFDADMSWAQQGIPIPQFEDDDGDLGGPNS